MSFSVLVIPEDPVQNGHILRPLVRALMRDVGRPNARVNVLTQPRVRGYDQAIRTIREALYANYGFLDLWLFFPDADKAGRDAMRDLEAHVAALGRCGLMCCVARPELEIFACAGFRNQIPEAWDDVRQHPRMKEEIFTPLLREHGDARRPGGGRDLMMAQSLRNLRLLFQLCPELRCLRDRIAAYLKGN